MGETFAKVCLTQDKPAPITGGGMMKAGFMLEIL